MRWKSCLKVIVVFVLSAVALALVPGAWAAAKYSVLYNFKGGKDGLRPSAGLISDAAGNLYGVTAGGGLGGNGGCGTVFKLTRVKDGWSQKVIYRFPGNAKDGCNPYANLSFDSQGNLYGTTYTGGTGDCYGRKCGTVFELTPTAGGKWMESVLHRFAGGKDGDILYAGVVLNAAGDVFGTTRDGGTTSCKCGTVFELMPQAGGGWSNNLLHSFSGTDGADPSGLIFDTLGNLYGVTNVGGTYDAGVAFELSPASGGGWSESTIYNFEGSSGAGPVNGLALEKGNLYGTTIVGGAGNWGTIFELKHESKGGWTHDLLYSFTGGKDGRYPGGSLVFDRLGNLYGDGGGDTTCMKGNRWGCGNIFELLPQSEGHWQLRVLHTFTGGSHGAFPSGPAFDGGGNLFGVAYDGGDCKRGGDEHCGVAFEITP
jgi:uncharacterized repeat protein (TIGR03803 family)